MYSQLVIFGYLYTVILAAVILLPWLYGKRHLVSLWNMFLLGTINFLTLGMVSNAQGIGYGEFTNEVWTFIAAMAVFYGLATAIYLWPARADKPMRFNNWPHDSDKCMRWVALSMGFIGVVIPVLPGFQFVQILFILNGPMTITAFAIACILWLRKKSSVANILTVYFTFVWGAITVFTYGTGRRELLSLMFVIPVVAYWFHFRHRPKGRTMIAVAITAAVGLLAVTAYSTERHEGREAESITARVAGRLVRLPGAMVRTVTNFTLFGEQGAVLDGQNAVYCGLLTIALTESDSGGLEKDTLALPTFVVVNPYPRAFWPDKPIGLGKLLPLAQGEPVVTWGPSVIGHCFYDGGWWVVILYGAAFGFGFRWYDLRLQRDPNNPWRVAIFASVLGHLVGLPRGDCGTFLVNILGPLVLLPVMLQVYRWPFKTRNPWASTGYTPAAGAYQGSLMHRVPSQ